MNMLAPITTAKNLWGIWEAAVFHRGFLGLPGKSVCAVCPSPRIRCYGLVHLIC